MKAHPERYGDTPFAEMTGIYVRAQKPEGGWDSVDIATLDEPSLTEWLRSRGGANLWAENVVRILLGWPCRTESGEVNAHK